MPAKTIRFQSQRTKRALIKLSILIKLRAAAWPRDASKPNGTVTKQNMVRMGYNQKEKTYVTNNP
jgi:hypothetical protein